MDIVDSLQKKLNRKPTAQEIQDEIFDTMTIEKKFKLMGQLSKLGLKLSSLDDGNYRPNRIIDQDRSHS